MSFLFIFLMVSFQAQKFLILMKTNLLFFLSCFGGISRNALLGTSLVVWWLRLHASTAGGVGLIPGWGIKNPACRVAQPKIKKERKKN